MFVTLFVNCGPWLWEYGASLTFAFGSLYPSDGFPPVATAHDHAVNLEQSHDFGGCAVELYGSPTLVLI